MAIKLEGTALYKRLLELQEDATWGPNAKLYVGAVQAHLDKLPALLERISNTFPHYTSHAVDHSVTIIDRMGRCLPSDTLAALTSTEIYILIAGALLHDLGMVVPEREYTEIETQDSFQALRADTRLQRFFEAAAEAVETGDVWVAAFNRRYLIAEWVRRRHAERAAELVLQLPEELGVARCDDPYIAEAIANVCRAHGFTNRVLLTNANEFPRSLLVRDDEVDVAFCAVLLRLGDLLDLGHERACPLVRNIAEPLPGESPAHWGLHRAVRPPTVNPQQIKIVARCETRQEHALLQAWCEWLRQEALYLSAIASQSPRMSITFGVPEIDIQPKVPGSYQAPQSELELEKTHFDGHTPQDALVQRIFEVSTHAADPGSSNSASAQAGPAVEQGQVANDIDAALLTLRSTAPFKRYQSSRALGQTGDRRAVVPLISRLSDGEWFVRSAAAEALGQIGDARALDGLVCALRDGDASVRAAAARALRQLGHPGAVGPLVHRLNDHAANVRSAAAAALGDLGDARVVQPLIDRLGDNSGRVAAAAAWALGSISDPRAVRPLMARLNEEHPGLRGTAVWALGKIGDAEAFEVLMKRLKDEHAGVRGFAAWALGRTPGPPSRLLPELHQLATTDPEEDVRQEARGAISTIEDAWGVPRLSRDQALARQRIGRAIPLLRSEHPHERQEAAATLGELRDVGTADALIDALRDEVARVREAVVDALGHIRNARAVPALIEALDDESSRVRRRAAEALGAIGDSRAADALIRHLGDGDQLVKVSAALALGSIPEPSSVDALLSAMDDEDAFLNVYAMWSLGQKAEPRCFQAILSRLSHSHAAIRAAAAIELPKFRDSRAVQPLIAALSDNHPCVRADAAYALGEMAERATMAHLLRALEDPEPIVRVQAAIALGKVGNAAAVEPLLRLLDDEHPRVCARAAESLRLLGLPVSPADTSSPPVGEGEGQEAAADLWEIVLPRSEHRSDVAKAPRDAEPLGPPFIIPPS